MPNIVYVHKKLETRKMKLIEQANEIIEEYTDDGYVLTLRQLYYQLVARGMLENLVKEYKRLGDAISDGRVAGYVDWDAIEDRTRNLETQPSWTSPSNIVRACAEQFRIDKWAPRFQSRRPEVWVEKEALAGVFERVCHELQVPYIACRGYMSQSEMWAAGQRFRAYKESGQRPFILHFGDHDPSGIDMTRDIDDRIEMFMGLPIEGESGMGEFTIKRLALNMEQVRKYSPPPNPAKATDSRFAEYEEKYGDQSWELDALEPKILVKMVEKAIREIRNEPNWQKALAEEAEHKRLLSKVSDRWISLTAGL